MPFQFEELTTSSGIQYLRIEVSGQVELADGKALEAYMLRSSKRDARVLSVVSKGTEYSPEVRKFFPTLNDKYFKLAAVVTNPLVRAAVNVMMRLGQPQGGIMRMFPNEQEALEWLESP
jgi:hypothetical protein